MKDYFELHDECKDGDVMEYNNDPRFRITKGLKKGVFCDNQEYGLEIDHLFEKKWKKIDEVGNV